MINNVLFPAAIREDRTRGGRSTYQCAPYPLPPSLVTPNATGHQLDPQRLPDRTAVKAEPSDGEEIKPSPSDDKKPIPLLLQVSLSAAVFIYVNWLFLGYLLDLSGHLKVISSRCKLYKYPLLIYVLI